MAPVVMLVAYAAGIVLPGLSGPGEVTGHASAAVIFLLVWLLLRRSHLAWLPLLGLLLLAGSINGSLGRNPPLNGPDISHFTGTSPLVVEGTIVSMENRLGGGYRLLVETLQVIDRQKAAKVTGTVMLYIKEGQLQGHPGQVVRWRSELRQPTSYGNPGEFDYPLYLAASGVYVTAFISHAEDLVTLANHPREHHTILENVRRSLSEHIDQAVPEEASSALLQSLLIGLRGRISHDMQRKLAAGGVAHLFAISGLHLGLLALLLYQTGKWLYTRSVRLTLWCPPQKILPVVILIPLSGYLFLTGNAWSTRRAFLMVSLLAMLLARGRRTHPLALLATVAFALLLFNPLALFQPGFQLSFCGVAGILLWLPK